MSTFSSLVLASVRMRFNYIVIFCATEIYAALLFAFLTSALLCIVCNVP